MVSNSDSFRIEQHEDVVLVVVAQEVESLEASSVREFAEFLLDPTEQKPEPLILFDLGELAFCGSIFISLLTVIHKRVALRGGLMALCGARRSVRDMLHVLKMDRLWPIYGARSEALAELLQPD